MLTWSLNSFAYGVFFGIAARRMAAARKMKQLRGENPDNDTEQNDDDLLAEMTPGEETLLAHSS